jgi:pimeloyl-ACP methyl ester carboxylesterase
MKAVSKSSTRLNVEGAEVELDLLHRSGPKTAIVFLHGFGSTKEDYADIVFWPEFDGHEVLAWDAPGFGASTISDPDKLSIPFLVQVATQMLAQFNIGNFHLIGHSMGGLTALLLAHELGDRVLSFTNIEGNIAPEDCFLSRQIVTHFDENPDGFMEDFQDRNRASPFFSHHLYAATLPYKVQSSSPRPIFESMVELSDNMPLMDWFTSLPDNTTFIHGDQNAGLTYLPKLCESGVNVVSIPHSGHFPMYANAPAMWAAIAANLAQAEDVSIQHIFVYGTLRPGDSNEHVMKDIRGEWRDASISGVWHKEGWGYEKFGLPGMVVDKNGEEIKGLIFSSANLQEYWVTIDNFEGPDYERVKTQAVCPNGDVIEVNVYALKRK